MNKILEIACFNIESCIIAQNAGADRIELCENYESGGVTPSDDLIIEARKEIKIPLHVMIRPRSGNYVYSKHELGLMEKKIEICKQNKIDGIVFGILTNENRVNVSECTHLLHLAKPMSVTFHRAIDCCNDIESAIKTLTGIGFNRVLTSGAKINAHAGMNVIKTLNEKFGESIIIMPGGGIRSSNLSELTQVTGCSEFHSSALTSENLVPNGLEIKKLKSQLNLIPIL